MNLKVTLDIHSVENAISELKRYQANLDKKMKTLCERLANICMTNAISIYSNAEYDGDPDWRVEVTSTQNGYAVVASGQSVLFIEFGAGITKGYGHPLAKALGMGPGTWPDPHGRKIDGKWVWNWENPKGWHFINSSGERVHTYGTAPTMAMYQSAQYIRKMIGQIAREVFADD